MSTTVATDDDRAGQLFDFAVINPEGFTNEDAMTALGWGLSTFNKATRTLRLILADDSITLVCDPVGENERWRYRLVGTYEDSRGWSSNRIRDMEARIETIRAVALSIVTATDGRTSSGRKARLIVAVLGALREQLFAMSDQGHLWGE